MKQVYDREKIKQMYAEGYSDQKIADAVGCKSEQTIRDLLIRMGVAKQAKYKKLDIQKVRALAKAGWTVEEIEYEFAWQFGIEQIRDALAG